MSGEPHENLGTADTSLLEVSADELLAASARARVGTTLRGKWVLDVLLGVGGMAAVYAATHRNKSRAAVKVLHRELGANQEVRARFLREGYVANAVEHDGVVKVLDDDTAEDGSLFLVTELLDGETLEDRRLRMGGKLDPVEVLEAVDQLLDVLVVAHAKGVVHRDLKPENLFLTRDGRLKVLDFGIARLRELWTSNSATRSGAAMGTPSYMPPEQARGLWAEVDARSDLWAVGATMFCLLTGKLVHEGRTVNETLLSAMTKPAPKLATLAPTLDSRLIECVDRALEFGRPLRWPDAAAMQAAVRLARRDEMVASAEGPAPLSVPPTVANRTLPGATAPVLSARLPTTGQPVSESLSPSTRSQGQLATLAGAGLLIAIGGVLAGAWVARRADRGHATAPLDPDAAGAPSTSLSAEPVAVPPESSGTSKDSLPPLKPAAKADGGASRSTVPSGHCNPPFVIDLKTGKKMWKAECL